MFILPRALVFRHSYSAAYLGHAMIASGSFCEFLFLAAVFALNITLASPPTIDASKKIDSPSAGDSITRDECSIVVGEV